MKNMQQNMNPEWNAAGVIWKIFLPQVHLQDVRKKQEIVKEAYLS